MMTKNIFLDIIERKLPADIVYEDEHCLAFRDIHPQAPTHLLIIPKKEIRLHSDVTEEDVVLLGRMHLCAAKVARDLGLDHYRLVLNCGEGSGQSVPHLHLHLLGGRPLHWPPG